MKITILHAHDDARAPRRGNFRRVRVGAAVQPLSLPLLSLAPLLLPPCHQLRTSSAFTGC